MSDLIVDGHRFVNPEHRDTYRRAKRLLDDEIERERRDAERLDSEWKHLPDDVRTEHQMVLTRHFAACREPYVKLLCDVLAIASPVILIETPQ